MKIHFYISPAVAVQNMLVKVHYFFVQLLSIALELKLHLEQMFAWGPHVSNPLQSIMYTQLNRTLEYDSNTFEATNAVWQG